MYKPFYIDKYQVTITALSSSLYQLSEKTERSENVLVIIKPLSTLEVVRELPTGEQYVKKIHHLIQAVAQLTPSQYQVEEDVNPITGELDQQYILVRLSFKEDADKLYNAQPYFGCLVGHKLSHIQI